MWWGAFYGCIVYGWHGFAFEFEVKTEVQDGPERSTFVGDHGDWGDFEVVWDVVFYVTPLDDFGKTLADFVRCFFSQCGVCSWLFCADVGAAFDGCDDVFLCPRRSAIRGASLCGVAPQERDGWVCVWAEVSLGVHELVLTYGGFYWEVVWDGVGFGQIVDDEVLEDFRCC